MVILFDGVGCKTLDTELVISAVCSKLRSKKDQGAGSDATHGTGIAQQALKE